MKKLTINIEVEIQDGRGLQEIATGVVDRVEKAIRASMPEWAAVSDVKMRMEHGQTSLSVAPVTVKTAHVQDVQAQGWRGKGLAYLNDTQGIRIRRARA